MADALITLDEWEVLQTNTLLICEGQEARLIITPEDPLIVRIRFETTPSEDKEPRKSTIEVSGEGNDGCLTFSNWNNSLGAATGSPLEIATDDNGRAIAVMCASKKIGECNEVLLQFMRREQR